MQNGSIFEYSRLANFCGPSLDCTANLHLLSGRPVWLFDLEYISE